MLMHPDLKLCLIDIIVCIIRQQVLDAVVRNNELPTDDIFDKHERLDINCLVDDGQQVNIEMQSSHMEELPGSQHANLKNRAVYYLCDLFSTQSIKGKQYHALAKTYQITFCTYTVFPERAGFVNEFSLRNEDGEQLNDSVIVIFVELSKLAEILQKPVEEMTSLEMWSIFFAYADKPEHRELIERIAEAKGEIKMALNTLLHVSQDERERAINMSRRKWWSDYESDMATSREIGIIKGREEGRTEGRAEGRTEGRAEGREIEQGNIVLRMRSMGMNDGDIAKLTGYSIDDVKLY